MDELTHRRTRAQGGSKAELMGNLSRISSYRKMADFGTPLELI
jgi:hypothetical protein